MQTVVETPSYLNAAKDLRITAEMRSTIVNAVSADPRLGDAMVGTGGCRKFRWGKDGKGKSGGVRVISFYSGAGMPVFLLTMFGKNEQANLTKAERNDLAAFTRVLVDTYRARRR